MGMMIDGQWQRDDLRSAGANFVRPQTVFRSWVTADGSPGPSGEGGFKAERGRYHLYVSLACPWAHRPPPPRNLCFFLSLWWFLRIADFAAHNSQVSRGPVSSVSVH
jgi:glutathionyl-hydroquinone reductase